MRKIYFIAGEASGDLHGAKLIHEIKKLMPISCQGWGGDLMQKEGLKLQNHYRNASYMGFVSIIRNIPNILKDFSSVKSDILSFKPDACILIDYPGFNLRMARWLHSKNIPVIYYISPQIWAWNQRRALVIKAYVDLMLCILPFEKAFYSKYNIDVSYVGHPLIEDIKTQKTLDRIPNQIALLPGSRIKEIKYHLPIMLDLAAELPDRQFFIAGVDSLAPESYTKLLDAKGLDNVTLRFNQTAELLRSSQMAIVCSGTASLEAALYHTPQVVVYKTNKVNYYLAKMLIKVKYISLVNLILEESIVTELIQSDFNTTNLKKEIQNLENEEYRQKMVQSFRNLEIILGEGKASSEAAKEIFNFLKSK